MKIRCILSCFIPIFVLLPVAVQAESGDSWEFWPPEIQIQPEKPTASDEIAITLSGLWMDTCVPNRLTAAVEENTILLQVFLDYPEPVGCGDAITPWELSTSIGPLEAGRYLVYATLNGTRRILLSELIVQPEHPQIWPPDVVIAPENPTTQDPIEIGLSGIWRDSCVPAHAVVRIKENAVYLELSNPFMRPCLMVLTPWEMTIPLDPLPAGDYKLFASFEGFGPTLLTEFSVVPAPQPDRRIYEFIPVESIVIQTGGFAGIERSYRVVGLFSLVIDWAGEKAAFEQVDAWLHPLDTLLEAEASFLPTHDLNEIFNLTGLESTQVTHESIRFEGTANEDTPVVIDATFTDRGIHLVGWATEPCCDRYTYFIDAFAVQLPHPVCRPKLPMDFNNDCRVDLADFARFAQEWLACNLFPQSACWE
ncbi:MAG: hypothetical protein JW828_16850 [Sedimentisphaerales bacterium]|nr:hypothetical protein [Sedimentisphaerales bacterium]